VASILQVLGASVVVVVVVATILQVVAVVVEGVGVGSS
jgi:hypothetical protein